ncbi:hypothetical protein K458DRAFT_384408 [Lentithecium fluviatile CBS 122367]|uniref:Uncharacterized protein n=1 Tax=Lentithecium fluviatile CBS 122367 TaxID=1168545 RepID=A0A6G1JHS0_9PLEO|nr:hypothetical protein K458DRAFT_384408 [Lentithecium fluviatile CBS 122367]
MSDSAPDDAGRPSASLGALLGSARLDEPIGPGILRLSRPAAESQRITITPAPKLSPTMSSETGLASRFTGVPLLEEVNGVLERDPRQNRKTVYECAFWFLSCSYISDNEEEWNTHCLSHFRGEEPPRSVRCPLCEFQGTWDDGWTAWNARMDHIGVCHHMLGETLKTSRPDFHLFAYLWQRRLIDDQDLIELKGGNHNLARPPSNFRISNARRERDSRIQRSRHVHIPPREPAGSVDQVQSLDLDPVHDPVDEDNVFPGPLRADPPPSPAFPACDNGKAESQVRTQVESIPPTVRIEHLSSTCALNQTDVVGENLHMDSGYGSMTNGVVEQNDDAMSTCTIITNASRVSLPGVEREQVTSAFSGDLCQDIGFQGYQTDARSRVLASLPDLLKTFSERLGDSATSKAQYDAKEFLRQQRDPLEDEDPPQKSTNCMSVADKMALWNKYGEPEPSSEPEAVIRHPEDAELPPRYEEGTMLESISKAVGRHLRLPNLTCPQDVETRILMDWDLPNFLKTQEYGSTLESALERAITITGSEINAQATTCLDYMCQTWPSTGREVLGMLKKALKSPLFSCSYTIADRTRVTVKFRESTASFVALGRPAVLTELCEGLAWLGCALRCSPPRTAYQVKPNVRVLPDDVSSQNMPSISVRIGFWLTSLVDESTLLGAENGACWHALFRGPLVVNGFPISARYDREEGLEVPFEMMTSLADSRFATHYDRSLLLKGLRTMLVPTRFTEQSVVWHFLCNQEERIPYFAYRQQCPDHVDIDVLNIHKLQHMSLRNFVGWAPNVTRHIGTNDVLYERVEWAGARKCSAGLAVEPKLTISASKILGISGSFVRGNRDKPEYVKQPAYAMQIEAARHMNVVLYDVASRRGWLVDGASALLHTVRTKVARKPYHSKSSPRNNGSFDPSTFKHPEIDGGQQVASDALTDERNMKHIVLREFDSYADETVEQGQAQSGPRNASTDESASLLESGTTLGKKAVYKSTCFKELVSQVWSTLEQIYDRQIEDETIHGMKQLSYGCKTTLEGYEFMDIVSNKHVLRRRFISLKSNGPAWTAFARQIHAVTLFGQHFGELYKPALNKSLGICEPWRAAPKGCEYLVAPMSLLIEIKEQNWKDGEVDQYSSELAHGHFWYPSPGAFALCRTDCSHNFSDRVQHFRRQIEEKDRRGKRFWMWNQRLYDKGAVLFGKDSVLQSVGTSPNTPPKEKLSTDVSHHTISPAMSKPLSHMEGSFQDSGLGSSLHQSTGAGASAADTPGSGCQSPSKNSSTDSMGDPECNANGYTEEQPVGSSPDHVEGMPGSAKLPNPVAGAPLSPHGSPSLVNSRDSWQPRPPLVSTAASEAPGPPSGPAKVQRKKKAWARKIWIKLRTNSRS